MIIIITEGHHNPFLEILSQLGEIRIENRGIKEALKTMSDTVATQADIDELTQLEKDNQAATIQAIADSKASLTQTAETEHEEVMTQIQALEAAHPAVDLTALKAAITGQKDAFTAAISDSTQAVTAAVQGVFTPDVPPPPVMP